MNPQFKLLWLPLIYLFTASQGGNAASLPPDQQEPDMAQIQLANDLTTVRQARILFSHHSVGANILAGIRRVDGEHHSPAQLKLASLKQHGSLQDAALYDISGGRNGDPKSKIDFFAATLLGNKQLMPDIAFMKLCYVDFNPHTDVAEVFNYYRVTLEMLKRARPDIKFAHVTAPLTVWPTELKWRIYRQTGREVWEDAANVKRAEFNRLLLNSFSNDPVFDLARVEATAPDGNLTTFAQNGRQYASLYPGYTEDGEHLNEEGQRVAGKAAIRFLAGALRDSELKH